MKSLLVDAINDKLFNQIVEAINTNDSLYLLVDSYGGDLRAGYKIYDYIRGRKNVYCNVIGNCMSAAVLVLLGVSKENRTANEHAQFLIHRPLLEYEGQLTQKIAKQVDVAIETETKQLMKVYKQELNASDKSLMAMLDAEQVFGARQAVAMGFVSSINETNNVEHGELEEATMLDIAYNQKLINNKNNMEKKTLNECLNAIKNLFGAKEFKNEKVVSTVDGLDIKVDTDADIKEGDACDAPDGTYVLGDNRTIVVENGAIVSIETPTTNEADDLEAKKEEGEGCENKEPEPNAEDEEKKKLQDECEKLKNKLASANEELAKLKDIKENMEKFENVNKLINDAGGIEAVLGAFSKNPSKKSENEGVKDDASYDFIKSLG